MSLGKYRKASRKSPKIIAEPKKVVGVIYGGPSDQHATSLKNGAAVIEILQHTNIYSVRPIIIDRQGNWFVNNINNTISEALEGVDVIFNALSGEYGQDGTIQGLLLAYGVPHTGSTIQASIICADKKLFQLILNSEKIKIAMGNKPEISDRKITIHLLEKYNNEEIFVFPAIEQITDKNKELPTEEITPADLPADLKKTIEKTAIEVFQAVGARHYSRIDMIIDMSHNVFVLEINTLPGLTNTSLLPQQAAAVGLPLEKLLEHLLQLAMSSLPAEA